MSHNTFLTIVSICEAKNTNASIHNYCNYCETNPYMQKLNNTLNKYIAEYNKLIQLLYEEKISNSSSSDKQKELIQQIDILNEKLNTLLSNIKNKITEAETTNTSIHAAINDIKNRLYNNKYMYENQNKDVQDKNTTIVGQYQDRKLKNNIEKYTFFAWLLLSITILAITVHSIFSNNKSNYENAVILIVCLLCIYGVAKWIYTKI